MSADPLDWLSWQRGDKDQKERFIGYIGDPQNFNLYTYVGNDPTDKTDPTGLWGDMDFGYQPNPLANNHMTVVQGVKGTVVTMAVAGAVVACAAGCGPAALALGSRIATTSPTGAVAIPTINNALTEGNPISTGAAAVTAGRNFTQAQKAAFIKQNMVKNGGVLRSDISGEALIPAQQSTRGVSPASNEVAVDHWIPKGQGGDRKASNAAILSRAENGKKGSTMPSGPCPGGYNDCGKK
jgi:hypothetical protein